MIAIIASGVMFASVIFTLTYTINKQITNIDNELSKTQMELQHQRDESKLVYSELNDIQKQIKKTGTAKNYTTKELIVIVAKKVGINPKLAVAISRLETGNFTSAMYKQNNNVGGMRNGNGWIHYSSMLSGVNAFILCLKENYYDEGLTTPEAMQGKYCPDSSSWASKVRALMAEE